MQTRQHQTHGLDILFAVGMTIGFAGIVGGYLLASAENEVTLANYYVIIAQWLVGIVVVYCIISTRPIKKRLAKVDRLIDDFLSPIFGGPRR